MYFLVNLWTTFLQWEKAWLTLHSHLKQASLGLVRKTCPMSVLEQLYPTTERIKYWWISRTSENSYLIILCNTIQCSVYNKVHQQFRWSKAWNLAHLYTLICFIYYLHPAQVGQHSPGKGEIIWLGGQVAVRGHTLWWQFKRPLCQDKTWFTVSLDKSQIKLTPTLHKTPKHPWRAKRTQHYGSTCISTKEKRLIED